MTNRPFMMLVAACLVACGNGPAPKSPEPEPEFFQEVEAEEPEPEAEQLEEPEEEDPDKYVEPKMPPPEPPRQPCGAYSKSRCQVTQGCAWYEKAGKGECVGE